MTGYSSLSDWGRVADDLLGNCQLPERRARDGEAKIASGPRSAPSVFL